MKLLLVNDEDVVLGNIDLAGYDLTLAQAHIFRTILSLMPKPIREHRGPVIHLYVAAGVYACGFATEGSCAIADINAVTCADCVGAHKSYMEQQEENTI